MNETNYIVCDDKNLQNVTITYGTEYNNVQLSCFSFFYNTTINILLYSDQQGPLVNTKSCIDLFNTGLWKYYAHLSYL